MYPAGLRLHTWAWHDGSAQGLHHDLAVWLLFVADFHHIDLALDAVHLTGKAERLPPH